MTDKKDGYIRPVHIHGLDCIPNCTFGLRPMMTTEEYEAAVASDPYLANVPASPGTWRGNHEPSLTPEQVERILAEPPNQIGEPEA